MKKVFFVISLLTFLLGAVVYHMLFPQKMKEQVTVYFGSNSDFLSPATVHAMKDGYVVIGKEWIQFFDPEGFLKWKKKVFESSLAVDVSNDRIALCGKHSGDFFLLNRSGDIVYQTMGLGRVKSVKMLKQQSVGIQIENDSIYLYHPSQQQLKKIVIPEGKVMDFDYSAKKKQLAVVMLNDRLVSKLLVYSLSGVLKSGVNIGDCICYFVSLASDHITLYADDRVLTYDAQGRCIDEKQYEGDFLNFYPSSLSYASYKDHQLFIFQKNQQQKVSVADPDHLAVASNYMVSTNQGGMSFHSFRGSSYQMPIQTGAKAVHTCSKDSIVVEYAGKIVFYTK